MAQPLGRRERKKAATRRAIADAALELFTERGFEAVGVREVAEAADVSTATLFKHFPGKEALVFDEDGDAGAALVAAVRDRPAGQGIVGALHAHLRGVVAALDADDPQVRRFLDLVQSSEALREYARRRWLRHEAALTAAIVAECGDRVHPTTCGALAHFALESLGLLAGEPDPVAALDRILVLLEQGWRAHVPGASGL
ncbi:TetR/AcrR family transcriptional regulator [Actinomycetospora sp. TBRC 11914]|uniref:TetR/AcrR family transcriptional regulator n=1 Tax=Actinomycetospora sp. TBRC 11914 TaxID=2729387 RepID=UPI00145F3416|nr:TetR/AcrR family transcriptional regulator [Actinomycetospora sp. TBRC 11914]NMO88624.1 TetR family transcriptional regulator [Actinomycetospora sp. TBRC 11914]